MMEEDTVSRNFRAVGRSKNARGQKIIQALLKARLPLLPKHEGVIASPAPLTPGSDGPVLEDTSGKP